MFFYYYDEEKDTTVPMELDDNKLNTGDFEFFNDGIRKVWNLQEEEWYFSIVDIVQYLTDSTDPKQYIKKCVSEIPSLIRTGVQFVPYLLFLLLMGKSIVLKPQPRKASCALSNPSLPKKLSPLNYGLLRWERNGWKKWQIPKKH